MTGTTLHYGMIGESPDMHNVYRGIERVANSPTTVYIAGESGTGKELVARALHEQSRRCDKPFARVSVAEFSSGDLLEAHLFGIEKGVATAVTRREGLFMGADGGTLFLDEIAEMSLPLQAKLLRVLQEGCVVPVGGDYTKPIPFKVRLVAASSKPLEDYVEQGIFREDLYYRLREVYILVSPLRERREDIRLLADYFLAKAKKAEEKEVRFNASVYPWFAAQEWRGNVRELENAIKGAVAWTVKDELEPKDFLLYRLKKRDAAPASYDAIVAEMPLDLLYGDVTKALGLLYDDLLGQVFQRRLEHFKGNISQTARSLKLDRGNFRRVARRLGIRTS